MTKQRCSAYIYYDFQPQEVINYFVSKKWVECPIDNNNTSNEPEAEDVMDYTSHFENIANNVEEVVKKDKGIIKAFCERFPELVENKVVKKKVIKKKVIKKKRVKKKRVIKKKLIKKKKVIKKKYDPVITFD